MANKIRSYMTIGIISIMLFGVLFSLSGCGHPRGVIFEALETPLVWPEPPDQPRIRYVGQISTEDDLKKAVTWHEGFVNAIFGKDDVAVLVGPYGVVKDADDKLFVADTGSSVVQVYDLENRTHSFFSSIDDGQALVTPVALSLVDGKVYVVDSKLGKVCVFNKRGEFITSFGQDQLKRPTGLAYCRNLQRFFVADTGKHMIAVYNKKGDFLETIGQRGSDAGSFNFPTHLWVDKFNKLYVCDTLNYRVQIFATDGRHLSSFGQHGDRPGSFAHPCGVASDSFGNIYVTDRKFENIQIFNSDGKVLMAIGQEGSNPGQFWLPGGIFIDDDDSIYIADSFNKRIQVFELIEEQLK